MDRRLKILNTCLKTEVSEHVVSFDCPVQAILKAMKIYAGTEVVDRVILKKEGIRNIELKNSDLIKELSQAKKDAARYKQAYKDLSVKLCDLAQENGELRRQLNLKQ